MAGIGKRFVKGDPRAGRPKGTPNKTGADARRLAQGLVGDPEYLEKLKERLIQGKLGDLEKVLWAYAYGPPPAHPTTPLDELLDIVPPFSRKFLDAPGDRDAS